MGRTDEEKEEKEEDKSPQLIYIFHTEHTLHWKCWKIFIIESGSSCTFCATSTPSSISPPLLLSRTYKKLVNNIEHTIIVTFIPSTYLADRLSPGTCIRGELYDWIALIKTIP